MADARSWSGQKTCVFFHFHPRQKERSMNSFGRTGVGTGVFYFVVGGMFIDKSSIQTMEILVARVIYGLPSANVKKKKHAFNKNGIKVFSRGLRFRPSLSSYSSFSDALSLPQRP